MKPICLAVLAICAPHCTLAAQNTSTLQRITPQEIDAHIQFLASDLLEGRAPAARGDKLATEYIATQLKAYGVEPGVNGSYYQEVPIDVVGSTKGSVSVTATGKANATLRYPDDVVVWAGSASPSSVANGELVFIGYGAAAPEYK